MGKKGILFGCLRSKGSPSQEKVGEMAESSSATGTHSLHLSKRVPASKSVSSAWPRMLTDPAGCGLAPRGKTNVLVVVSFFHFLQGTWKQKNKRLEPWLKLAAEDFKGLPNISKHQTSLEWSSHLRLSPVVQTSSVQGKNGQPIPEMLHCKAPKQAGSVGLETSRELTPNPSHLKGKPGEKSLGHKPKTSLQA